MAPRIIDNTREAVSRSSEWKLMGVIVLVTVLLRILFYLSAFKGFEDDFGWLADDNYDEIATNVLSGHGYVIHPGDEPNTTRTPLYTYFLLLHFILFGWSRISLVIVQSFLQAGAFLILYGIAKRIFHSRWIAFISAIALACYPQSMLYACQYLTESLYILLMMASAAAFLWLLRSHWGRAYVLMGGMLGLLTLCRPVSQFLIFPIGLISILSAHDHRRKSWLGIVMMALVFLAVLSPWMIRNYQITGGFFSVTTFGSRYLYSNTIALPEEEEAVVRELQSKNIQDVKTEEARWFQLAVRNIMRNPFLFLKNTIRTSLDFWHRGHSLPISIFNAFVNFPLLLLGILGMWSAWKKGILVFPFLIILLYFNGIYGLLHAISRYSFPVIPFVIMYAVYGLMSTTDWLGNLNKEVRDGIDG
jgi:4-amino-4-deoxy-L-arabinose transferase-like glycosyltransferase